MATSIFFLGRTIRTPGSYSRVDATGLEQPGLGAAGIVAIIGDAEGGRPANTMNRPAEFIRLNNPQQVRDTFRSGDLREAAAMAFEPSNDPNITAGAAQVIAMKVNPSTQSTATLDNASGAIINLTSEDYGAFTEQINISLATASAGLTGYLVTVRFEDTIETADGVGGDALARLQYRTSTRTWENVNVDVLSAGAVRANGTYPAVGRSSEQLASPATGTASVIATAADAGKTIELYGTTATGTGFAREVLTLIDGTVTSTTVFTDILGAVLSAPAAGAITVDDSASTDIFTFAATERERGGYDVRAFYLNNSALTLVGDDASVTQAVVIYGRNSAGLQIAESVTMTGTTAVTGTQSYRQIDFIALTNVAGARTVTASGVVAQTVPATQSNVQQAADYYNALTDVDVDGTTVVGFLWTNLQGLLTKQLTEFDEVTGTIAGDQSSPVAGANLFGDTFELINWINNNSSLITAALATGVTRTPPLNTTSPRFLTGGAEGTSTVSNYQNALNLLQQTVANTVVVLSGNSAVHAALSAHCNYMAGIGRNERDGLVGIVAVDSSGVPTTSPPTLPTRQQYLDQITALNTRHLRACGQSIDRFDTNGTRTTFQPWFQATLGAAMQAGSPVGVSLTNKFANVLDVRNDSSWNPTDDSEQLIQGGAFFMESVEGVGLRWVRNVTTFLQSDNIAFTEASVNEAVNFATRTFRTNLEFAVGRRGFANTLAATRGIAVNSLGLLADEGVITAFRGLTLTLNVDVLDVSVEIAPIIPINFVRSVIHLVTVQQTA